MVAFHNTAMVVAETSASERVADAWAETLVVHHAAVSVLHPGWMLVRLTVLADSPEEAAEFSRGLLRRTTDAEPYVLSSMSELALERSLGLLEPLIGDDPAMQADWERSGLPRWGPRTPSGRFGESTGPTLGGALPGGEGV